MQATVKRIRRESDVRDALKPQEEVFEKKNGLSTGCPGSAQKSKRMRRG